MRPADDVTGHKIEKRTVDHSIRWDYAVIAVITYFLLRDLGVIDGVAASISDALGGTTKTEPDEEVTN